MSASGAKADIRGATKRHQNWQFFWANSEYLLFPKADVQTSEIGMKLRAANGQKRTST
jgi:hypothetical protein